MRGKRAFRKRAVRDGAKRLRKFAARVGDVVWSAQPGGDVPLTTDQE